MAAKDQRQIVKLLFDHYLTSFKKTNLKTKTTSATTLAYRYPGAPPFTKEQAHLFYGRSQDIEQLHRLISLEDLVVLYSKSGLGKSSLINAGILPKLEEEGIFDAQSIRFGAYSQATLSTPTQVLAGKISELSTTATFLDEFDIDQSSLWFLCKKLQISSGNNNFILFFDQFEELFTYPKKQVHQFKRQLSDLVHTQIPQSFREIIEQEYQSDKQRLTHEQLSLLHKPLNVKLLLAIRSDRMSLLNGMKDFFPMVLKNCYQLEPLSLDQAEEAILSPAYKQGLFYSPVFDFEDMAIESMLDFLSKKGSQKIESFQLQILCRAIEEKVIRAGGLTLVKLEDIGNIEHIYENYYDTQISQLDTEAEQNAARVLIEEGLIFEEDERRLNLYEGQIIKEFDINKDLLTKLVDSRLLRAVPGANGGMTYELCHDTMVPPILKAKSKRKEQELLMEKERQLEEMAQRAKTDKRKRRQVLAIGIGGIALALISLIALAFAFNRSLLLKKANQESEIKAKANELSAQAIIQLNTNPTVGLRLAEEALKLYPEGKTAKVVLKNSVSLSPPPYYKAVLSGHRAYISSVAYSSDGNSMLTGSWDNTARLWDARGAVMITFTGHTEPVLAVAFAPGDQFVVTASRDNSAKIWDIQGNLLHSLEGHFTDVTAVAISPNAATIATGSWDGEIRLWGAAGKELARFPKLHTDYISSLAFSSDGRELLSGSWDDTALLFDRKGTKIRRFTGHKGSVSDVAFSKDDQQIFTGSWDSTAKLWDRSGKELQSFEGHSDAVSAVSISPDGEIFATASWDFSVKLWDKKGANIQTLDGHDDKVVAIAFSPDGYFLLSGSFDNKGKVWSWKGNELSPFQGHKDMITSVAYAPDGSFVVMGSRDYTASVWDITGEQMAELKGHQQIVNSVAISPDSRYIATAASDYKAILWDKEGNLLHRLDKHTRPTRSVAFSPDGGNLLTCSQDFSCIVWSLNADSLYSLQGHQHYIHGGCYSPDGQLIATTGTDGTARLWSAENGDSIRVIDTHTKNLAIAFSPDSRKILTGGVGGTLDLWNTEGKHLANFKGHTHNIFSVAFSPDGEYVLSAGSRDGTARLWDLQGNEMQTFTKGKESINVVAFSPDGKYVLVGMGNSTSTIFMRWDTFLASNRLASLSWEQRIAFGLEEERETVAAGADSLKAEPLVIDDKKYPEYKVYQRARYLDMAFDSTHAYYIAAYHGRKAFHGTDVEEKIYHQSKSNAMFERLQKKHTWVESTMAGIGYSLLANWQVMAGRTDRAKRALRKAASFPVHEVSRTSYEPWMKAKRVLLLVAENKIAEARELVMELKDIPIIKSDFNDAVKFMHLIPMDKFETYGNLLRYDLEQLEAMGVSNNAVGEVQSILGERKEQISSSD